MSTNHKDVLETNLANLFVLKEKVKALHNLENEDLLLKYINKLKEGWHPIKKQNDEDVFYRDVFHDSWTTEDSAFKGYVLREVSWVMNNLNFNTLNNEK